MKLALPVAILVFWVAQPATNDLNLDFRGSKFREAVLGYAGPNAKQFVKTEKEGLRITIPSLEKPIQQVGIVSKLAVQGDFEITLSYEILHAERPKVGYGAGVNLTVVALAPDNDTATIARRVHPIKGDVYATNRAFRTNDGKDQNSLAMFPTQSKSGTLRLIRTGSTLTFSASDPSSNGLQEFRSEKFVDHPIKAVRVTGDTGKSTGELDIRIHSLHIRSFDLVPSLPQANTSGSFIWPFLIVAMTIGFGAAVVYLGWRFYQTRFL